MEKRKTVLFKQGWQKKLETHQDSEVIFELNYKSLHIGTLKLEKGIWSFAYSVAFKKQERIKPLPDFPSVDKVYKNKELYPFFLHRIPSTKQPKVQREIKKNNVDATNEVDLLRYFGKRSISNPFLLQAV